MRTKKLLILLFILPWMAYGQETLFQPRNADFECWDNSQLTAEPCHWNSFATSDGTWASLASTPHHYHRNGSRPGGTGSSYLVLWTKSIIGVKANGNMTNGRIHAGSTTPSSSENYNRTVLNDDNFHQEFHATPDSLYAWVSFYASNANSEASISAWIHGATAFSDPNDTSSAVLYKGHATAHFARTTTNASTMQWQQIKVPFVYDGVSSAEYVLISMATNKTPGQGDANDSLAIDDLQFVYSSWLTDLTLDGQTLENFDKGTLDYRVQVESIEGHTIGYTTEKDDATVQVEQTQLDEEELSLLEYALTVTAEDGVTQHTYTLTLAQLISSGDTTTTDTTIVDTVGIAYAIKHAAASLYPNPAHDLLTISAPEGVRELTLYSTTGAVIWRHQLTGSETTIAIPVGDLPRGGYILKINDGEGRYWYHE